MSQIEITHGGHSCIIVNTGKKVIGIDPWISGPTTPESVKNLKALDYIFLTHGHSDHAGDTVSLAKKFGSKVYATYELAMLLIKSGIPESQVFPMNKGGGIEIDELNGFACLTHAMHSNSFEINGENVYAGEACGVVLQVEGATLYHAGDTALFGDMSIIGDMHEIDVVFIPIGDRFTMGPEEAALSLQLLNPKTVVPIHHSTFPLLTGSVESFAQCIEELDIEVEIAALTPGEVFILEASNEE